MRKLNASLENLILNNDADNTNETIDQHFVEATTSEIEMEKATTGSSGERKRPGKTTRSELNEKKMKLESHPSRTCKQRK